MAFDDGDRSPPPAEGGSCHALTQMVRSVVEEEVVVESGSCRKDSRSWLFEDGDGVRVEMGWWLRWSR